MAISETDRAWAAGFYDGEGNVTFVKGRKIRHDGSYGAGGQLRVQIGQVRREPLDRFLAVVGVGSVNGPYEDGRPNHNATYAYMAGGNPAFTAVWNIIGPYLCPPKQEQFLAQWQKAKDHYAAADVRRNDPRRLPPMPTI